jgi:hypothetical protein
MTLASAAQEAAVANKFMPPTVTAVHVSLVTSRGLAGNKLVFEAGMTQCRSEKKKIRVSMRWPGGGSGTGGSSPHPNLNESLPDTM